MSSAGPDSSSRGAPIFLENIKTLQDATHVITSTSGAQITAKDITIERRALDIKGHMADETQQKISDNHCAMIRELRELPPDPSSEATRAPNENSSFQGTGHSLNGSAASK